MPTILNRLHLDRIRAHLETERAERERIAAERSDAGALTREAAPELEPAEPMIAAAMVANGYSELASHLRGLLAAEAGVTVTDAAEIAEGVAAAIRARIAEEAPNTAPTAPLGILPVLAALAEIRAIISGVSANNPMRERLDFAISELRKLTQ